MPLSWVSEGEAYTGSGSPEERVCIGETRYMQIIGCDTGKQNGEFESQNKHLMLRPPVPAEFILWDLMAILKDGSASGVWCDHW